MKTKCLFPLTFDDFSVDREPGQPVPSDAFDIIETALESIEKKLLPDNVTYEFSYDQEGRLSSIDVLHNQQVIKSITFSYDDSGQLSQVTESSEERTVQTTFNYDQDGNLVSVIKAVVS